MARDSIEVLDADALNLINSSLEHPSSPSTNPQELFNGDRANILGHEAYCNYYKRQWHILALYGDRQHAAARSPQAIARLIQDIRHGRTREAILDELRSTNASEEVSERLINLAGRLLVMMRFGVTKHQVLSRRYLRWERGPLQEFVHDLFSEPPKLSCEQTRLPKSFDAWSIANVAGIEVAFTDNLADHLLLVEDDTKLLVFHHASFLEYHRSQSSMYPTGLVDETLRILALLFPQAQFSNQPKPRGPKRKWLQSLRAKHAEAEQVIIDPRLARCGTPQGEDRQIERFHFWRDRLVILKQTYDDAKPMTIGQWWRDRRNGVQWYTFWVAILVLIITTLVGVMQVILAGLQVYKAYKPSR